MLEGREVTWFPSYGAEVRGGTANCTVILSDALIGSPVVTHPDVLIVMNDASLNRFLPQLRQDGILFFDSSLIKQPIPRTDLEMVEIPATDISSRIGNTKSANMVMLGGWIAKTGMVRKESVFQAVESLMAGKKKNLIEDNKKAILEGIKHVEHTQGKDIRS
jgi:2-oxoglutarate ferredoxin oxidoreductase subunit gamma